MSMQRVYGDAVAHSFKLGEPPRLVTRSLANAQIAISRLSIGESQIGLSSVIPPEDTFVVAVYLHDLPYHELWSHKRPIIRQGYKQGAMRIVNLSDEYAANVTAPHETVVFYIPRRALDDFTEDAALPRVRHLSCEPGIIDPVIERTVATLLPAFKNAHELSALYVDHVTLAVCAHLCDHYGSSCGPSKTVKGGLTPRQVARTEAFIREHFASDLGLNDLALQCDLSRAHFAKAFKTSFGVTPHQWLLRHRIEATQAMMLGTASPVADIAVACGFADQSHMTRVFTRLTGSSPAQWRHQQRS